MAEKEAIRDFSGKIIAFYYHESNGDIRVTDFYGKQLGRYDAQNNVTREFSGRIVARGNCVGMLIGRG